jgi:CheY-like chemotaxis protein
MNISPHFTLAELTVTNTGLDNTPSPAIIENLKVLASTLERIRTLLGKPIQVTSAYRSTRVNNAVRGAAGSFHLVGLACDLQVAGMTPYEVCKAIQDSPISYDKLILEFDSWCHIQVQKDPAKNRMEEYTIRTGTGYLRGIVPK